MTGTTGLHNLHVECIVGIHPHERARAQSVFVDVEMDSDFGPATASDAIADAIDYTSVATLVTALLQDRKFQLLESMIEEVAVLLFDHDQRITAVRIEIRKPAAVPAAADSFVRIARVRRP
jgi:dihydroneopterin aldolase